MRGTISAIFRIVLISVVLYSLHKSVFQVHEGEILLVRLKSNVVKKTISTPGFHLIYDSLVPGRVRVESVQVKGRFIGVPIRKELSGGLLPEMGEDGYLSLNLSIGYSIEPDAAAEIVSEADNTIAKMDEVVSEIVTIKFFEKLPQLYKNPGELPFLNERIQDFVKNSFLTELQTDAVRKRGFKINEVRLKKISIPDPGIFLRLLNQTDLVLRAKIERSVASVRGEGYAIEQTKKDEAYFKRLKATAEFLKKYPELKEFATIDRLTDKVQVMVLPGEKFTGELLKDKINIKPKMVPKDIE